MKYYIILALVLVAVIAITKIQDVVNKKLMYSGISKHWLMDIAVLSAIDTMAFKTVYTVSSLSELGSVELVFFICAMFLTGVWLRRCYYTLKAIYMWHRKEFDATPAK